jgi:hypothetical protein
VESSGGLEGDLEHDKATVLETGNQLEQGDKIRQIFAYLVIVFFGQFLNH